MFLRAIYILVHVDVLEFLYRESALQGKRYLIIIIDIWEYIESSRPVIYAIKKELKSGNSHNCNFNDS